MRGRMEKDENTTRAASFRPRSPCSIAILPVRCKAESTRKGPENCMDRYSG